MEKLARKSVPGKNILLLPYYGHTINILPYYGHRSEYIYLFMDGKWCSIYCNILHIILGLVMW